MGRAGTPSWSTRRTGRPTEDYPQGWAQGPMRDNTLEYRLSIISAEERDTGLYTCTTPLKQSHSINILVMNISCQQVIQTSGLVMSTTSSILNTKVEFECDNGNELQGPDSITCLPTGKWSDIPPACDTIYCPDLDELLGEKSLVKVNQRQYQTGTSLTFSCPVNYQLVGPRSAECEPGGRWSLGSTLPTCKPIECQAPRAPHHGMIHPGFPGQEVFKVGDIVKFHCETGFMMQGSPVSACTDSSSWSRPPPRCVTACTYPGTTSGGIIDKVKFYYEIGETVRFSCSPGHELSGPALIKCLDSGQWSGGVPQCIML